MALDDPRPDDREDDREDDTDRAIKLAREHALHAVNTLSTLMYHSDNEDIRAKAAIALLEVCGCL